MLQSSSGCKTFSIVVLVFFDDDDDDDAAADDDEDAIDDGLSICM